MKKIIIEALKMWRGLRFFRKTNMPKSIVLASYHHPDSITWRWSIWWSFPLYFSFNTQDHMWRRP